MKLRMQIMTWKMIQFYVRRMWEQCENNVKTKNYFLAISKRLRLNWSFKSSIWTTLMQERLISYFSDKQINQFATLSAV